VLSVADAEPSLSFFVRGLRAARLEGILSEPRYNLTVLAPSNAGG
jgi:hypothetical protein